MTHTQKFQIGERVSLLSEQYVATVLEFSPASGKYRLDIPGWVKEHNGKPVHYWYSDEHMSPLYGEEKPTPKINPINVLRNSRTPKPLSSAVPGPDDLPYEPIDPRKRWCDLTLAQWNLIDQALCVAAARYRDDAVVLGAMSDPMNRELARQFQRQERETRALMDIVGNAKFDWAV
jgi:hypothetical protein